MKKLPRVRCLAEILTRIPGAKTQAKKGEA